MSNRDQPLTVEVVDDRLVIAIGIDALMIAVLAGDDWDEETTITSPEGFAGEIADELNREDEDGTTPVHLMIDAAALAALDAGSLCVGYAGDAE